MKKISYIVAIFLVSLSSFGQDHISNQKIDSLETILDNSYDALLKNDVYFALDQASKVAKKSHEIQNYYYLSKSYLLLGSIQHELIDYKTAKENLLKAIEYSKKTKEKIKLADILNNLANVYFDDQNDYKNALFYFKEAEKETKVKDRKQSEYETIILNIAWTHMELNQYDSADLYLKKADSISKTPNSAEYNKSTLYLLKARNYGHYRAIEKAEEYFTKAEKLIEKEVYWPKGKSFLYEYRSEMYESINSYSKALADKNKLLDNERKVFDYSKSKNQEIARSKFRLHEYEAKLKDNEKQKILLENKTNNSTKIIYISITALILLLNIVFFYYRGYRSKKRITKILESQNAALSKANEKAEKLSKMKSQFISTISHELRTPLYGVVGISSLLLENSENSEDKEPENDKNLLYSLKFSADYLLNLVNKVLDISKIDAEKTKLIISPTDLNSLSQDVIQSFDYQAKEKNNELIFEYDDKIPNLVDTDSLRISEVFINLIGNANKYTENGKIWLRLKLEEEKDEKVIIRFEIQDTGIGIPVNQQEHIFEEFSRIGSIFDNIQGTGLGLSIVKNILQTMDSKINFKSRKDVGSTFFFNLEVAISKNIQNMENTNNPTEAPEKNETSPTSPARILVAEDNKINQIVTKKLLKSIGYEGFIAEHGEEAVEMLKKDSYDLVLMDINMPVLDGMQATIKIREFNQETPIIALTAAELSEVEEECKNAGMNDLVNKPLKKEDLKIVIEKNLNR